MSSELGLCSISLKSLSLAEQCEGGCDVDEATEHAYRLLATAKLITQLF